MVLPSQLLSKSILFVGAVFLPKKHEMKDYTIEFEIWDTAG